MRARSTIARGLCLAAALAMVSPSADAATPRQKKASSSKRKAPAPKHEDEPSAVAKEEPAPPAEPEPVEVAPAKTATAEPERSEASPAKTPPVDAHEEPARAPELPAPTSDEAELGRREAARIAAGRIEVAVWAGGGVANRRFTYSDQVGYNLAPYRLPAAPMASFGIEAYPAAASGVPFLRDLGIRAHISRGFAFDSNTPQGVTLETNWTRFGQGMRLQPGKALRAASIAMLACVAFPFCSTASTQSVFTGDRSSNLSSAKTSLPSMIIPYSLPKFPLSFVTALSKPL